MSLRVLMSLEQQVDQPRDGSRLPQWRLVGGAQRQVPDQPDGGLVGEDRREIKETVSPWVISARGTAIRLYATCPWMYYKT